MRAWVRRALRSVPLVLLTMLLPAAGGCGRTATVSGRVTYQGRPVVFGSVIVIGEDGKAVSAAIEPDGTYTVAGIRPGPVQIRVLSPDPLRSRVARTIHSSTGPALAKERPTGWFALPPGYRGAAEQTLAPTVGNGRVHHDIDLK